MNLYMSTHYRPHAYIKVYERIPNNTNADRNASNNVPPCRASLFLVAYTLPDPKLQLKPVTLTTPPLAGSNQVVPCSLLDTTVPLLE